MYLPSSIHVDLRRISGLLLAEFFYNNDDIKERATQLLEIYPAEGRVIFWSNQDLPQPDSLSDTKIPLDL